MNNITPYNMKNIGERVLKAITDKGYNISTFCLELGMTRQTLAGRCKGNSSFTLEELVDIANRLDVSISYLLCEDDYTSKEKEVIGKSLKLREEAIDRIANYSDVEISMLNSLICYPHKEESKDNLRPLLKAIYEYKAMSCSDKSSIEVKNPIYNLSNKYTQKKEIESYLKYNVINVLEKCLEDDYWITDYISGISKELYLYKHHPRQSKLRKAENDLIHDIQQKSKIIK